LRTADFDYDLPTELIAQSPLERRDDSRLLVLDRSSATLHHSAIKLLPEWLAPDDLLVANNSRVIPARLRGTRLESGGAIEVLLLRACDGVWSGLARPAKRLRSGDRLAFPAQSPADEPATAVVEENLGGGEVLLRFEHDADTRLAELGEAPLPPYITGPLSDSERYQTIYGTAPGSAAAPTAGLHFTDSLIAELEGRGVGWAEVTLHIGLDTFRPVTAERIEDHQIHAEWCEVTPGTAARIAACREAGGRVVAVGTTAARTLETIGKDWRDADPRGFAGFTNTFITPGHRWRLVDALLTNFHLPRSSLLMLVSALAGRETILSAYAEAIRSGYRFYSFGDAMLIL
jgi:S-adenosylmethionine:tRNA ribosyltransferase-isomerase